MKCTSNLSYESLKRQLVIKCARLIDGRADVWAFLLEALLFSGNRDVGEFLTGTADKSFALVNRAQELYQQVVVVFLINSGIASMRISL